MAAEIQTLETTTALASRKRLRKHNKGKKSNKRAKQNASSMAAAKPRKPSQKMKKLFQKRAREYHSDDEDKDDEDVQEEQSSEEEVEEEGKKDLDLDLDYYSGGSERDDEDDKEGVQLGITRFVEGCRAFKVAFKKIMKRHLPDDPLGPILSAHRKLVAQKLAEEDAEDKTKGEMKKKHMAAEKGHIKPANFLDAKETSLISVATKGVVKLFNAVSKAQRSQSGLNPSSSKDAKVLAKRRKQAFFSELQEPAIQSNEIGWAPLRDTYMLASSKLKDWDKNPEPAAEVGQDRVLSESSSDEE